MHGCQGCGGAPRTMALPSNPKEDVWQRKAEHAARGGRSEGCHGTV